MQRVLQPLGLHLALEKCKLLVSPAVPREEFTVGEQVLEQVDTLLFLGVLLGFTVNSCMTLSARTVRATNVFYAFYKILTEPSVALASRLALLCRHVTSTWRWLPCCAPSSGHLRSPNQAQHGPAHAHGSLHAGCLPGSCRLGGP